MWKVLVKIYDAHLVHEPESAQGLLGADLAGEDEIGRGNPTGTGNQGRV
jgi:hypothetical protein